MRKALFAIITPVLAAALLFFSLRKAGGTACNRRYRHGSPRT